MRIPKRKVFISHSWPDKPVVRTLEIALKSAGIEVWVDHRGIRGGDNLPDEISNALNWCDSLILVWSSTSADSYWVKLEWTNALALKKTIVPCLIDETPLPSILSHKAYIRFIDKQEGIEQLLNALDYTKESERKSFEVNHAPTIDEPATKAFVQPEVVSQESRRVLGLTDRKWWFVLAGLLVVTIALTATYKLWLRSPEPGPRKGSVIRTWSPIVLIVLDVSQSLSDHQINQAESSVVSILKNLSDTTPFEIHIMQRDMMRSKPVVTMDSTQLSSIDLGVLRTKIREAVQYQRASDDAKISCIWDTLNFAEDFFHKHRSSGRDSELVIISDMIENCDNSLFGRRVDLERMEITDAIRTSETLPRGTDLSEIRMSFVLPTGPSSPRFDELMKFWQNLLRKRGFTDEQFNNPNHFVFSTQIPERFEKR